MDQPNADGTTDAESETETDTASDTLSGLSDTLVMGGAIATIGIIMSGIAVYILDRIGPPGSGELMWIFGYGLTIFALWYLLLRPIDFTRENEH